MTNINNIINNSLQEMIKESKIDDAANSIRSKIDDAKDIVHSLVRGYRKVTGTETIGDKSRVVGSKIKDNTEDFGKSVGSGLHRAGIEAHRFALEHPLLTGSAAAGAGLLGAGLAARKFMNRKKKNKEFL